MTNELLLRSHRPLHDDELPGGAARLMRNLAAALDESGWNVHVLCPAVDSVRSNPLAGATVFEFGYEVPKTPVEKMLNSVRGVGQFRELVRDNDYDVVLDDVSHIPFYPAHFLCPADARNGVFLHTAFFETARQYSGAVKGRAVEYIDRTLPYLNGPEIVCAGPSTESRVRSRLSYHRTHVLNPCIDLDQFTYRFDPSARRVLYLGRLSKRKNVSCLLEAWSLVERRHDEYRLTVAGTGPRERRLRKRSAELGLENVEFVGFVDEREKARLFETSLAFVLPSTMEGYATTGLEALASGTPIVGADTYGIRDYVDDGETGLLFEPDDSRALASVLDRVLEHPGRLEDVAARGRDLAVAHSYERFRENARELFEGWCG